ncbi:hypothetical protein AAG906_026111 [Vitis piasezkii]
MDMVRSMMTFSLLHVSFWGYTLDNTTYLLNLILLHIHIWGCPTHMLKPKVDKLEARSKVCQFVGYPKDMRGHYFYNLKALEDTPTSAQETIGPKVYTPTIPFSSSTPMPSHSGRDVIQLDSNDDIILWQGAMEVELEFMYSNGVWDLIEALKGIKPIGSKWVYKRKRGVDGKCPKTTKEKDCMKVVPYASTLGSLMYAMLCTRPNICFAVGMVYGLRFSIDKESQKSTFGFVSTLGGRDVNWRSVKQSCIVDSTMKVEYVTTFEEQNKLFGFRSLYWDLG